MTRRMQSCAGSEFHTVPRSHGFLSLEGGLAVKGRPNTV